jgi:hypothetical protein
MKRILKLYNKFHGECDHTLVIPNEPIEGRKGSNEQKKQKKFKKMV